MNSAPSGAHSLGQGPEVHKGEEGKGEGQNARVNTVNLAAMFNGGVKTRGEKEKKKKKKKKRFGTERKLSLSSQ